MNTPLSGLSHQSPIDLTLSECEWSPMYLLRSTTSPDSNCAASIDISDIIHGHPRQVLLMNFEFDVSWLAETCPLLRDDSVSVCCLHGSKGRQQQLKEEVLQLGMYHWTVSEIDMGPERYGTHHTKMIIMFYDIGARVAVLTANFTECDFKYMTQGVFVQDFPYKQESKGDVVTECLSPGESEFHRPLVEYLRRLYPMNQEARFLLNKAIKEIERCDFSSAEVALIPSVPGKHASNNSKWGRMRLESVLRRWCGANSAPIPSDSSLILQASSIGSLGKGEKYLAELTASMLVGSSENHHCKPPVELVWPTAECIRQSILGYCCGGSIPLRGDTIETVLADGSRVLKPGVESVLRKWDGSVSSRDLNPPHMKCYCRYSIVDAQDSVAEGGHNKRKASPTWVGSMKKLQKVDGDNTATSDETLDTTPANPAKIQLHWFLLSSANISQAAWGVSQRGGTQLYIKSFEMGVLFVPSMMKTFHRFFRNVSSLCRIMLYSGYGLRRSNESSNSGCKLFAFSHRDKPWICDKNYYEPDSCGRMWIPTP